MADQGDLPRALRFSLSHMTPGGATNETSMSSQDREWLREVIGQVASSETAQNSSELISSSGRNIQQVLQSFADLLGKGPSEHLKDSVKNELEHILEVEELIDRADDSDRRNSVAPIRSLFEHDVHELAAPLCSVLAELAQNSPDCQAEAMTLVPKLLEFIQSGDYEAQTRIKAVYALSAILRGNPSDKVAACLFAKGLKKEGVIDILVILIADKNESVQVRTKAAFLLSCLVEKHEVRQYLSLKHESTLRSIQEEDSNIREFVENTLNRIETNLNAEGEAPLALTL